MAAVRAEWKSNKRVRHMIDNVTTDWIGNSSPRNTISLFFFCAKNFQRDAISDEGVQQRSKGIWNENESCFTSFYFPTRWRFVIARQQKQKMSLSRDFHGSELRVVWCNVFVPRFESSPCLIICNNHFYWAACSAPIVVSRGWHFPKQKVANVLEFWSQIGHSRVEAFLTKARSREPSGDDSFSFDSLIWNSLHCAFPSALRVELSCSLHEIS